MIRNQRLLSLFALFALLFGCGRPPIPLDVERSATPPPNGHASEGLPQAHAEGHSPAPGSATLEVTGRIQLMPPLGEQVEGRLFLFVEDAHGGALILNRAYDLSDPAFVSGDGGSKVLNFELGEADRLGGAVSDGHLVLVARLDADGEVLTADDALAISRTPFDAGGEPLEVVLRPGDE